eukprot:1487257-Amphidinium_carterae.1
MKKRLAEAKKHGRDAKALTPEEEALCMRAVDKRPSRTLSTPEGYRQCLHCGCNLCNYEDPAWLQAHRPIIS